MAKTVFVCGGITAEDWSYQTTLAGLAIAQPSVAALLPDPPPAGLADRILAATLVTSSNEQAIIAQQAGRILELEELIAATPAGAARPG